MDKSLYHIERDYAETLAVIRLADGEVTEETAEALAIAEAELAQKAENYVHVINRLKSEVQLSKDRIEQEKKHIARLERIGARLECALVDAAQKFGNKGKIHAGPFVIGTRKSEGLVKPTELEETPKKYIHTVRSTKINFTAIKNALKQGRKVRGYSLETRENLSVR
jgi:hypothetical protein